MKTCDIPDEITSIGGIMYPIKAAVDLTPGKYQIEINGKKTNAYVEVKKTSEINSLGNRGIPEDAPDHLDILASGASSTEVDVNNQNGNEDNNQTLEIISYTGSDSKIDKKLDEDLSINDYSHAIETLDSSDYGTKIFKDAKIKGFKISDIPQLLPLIDKKHPLVIKKINKTYQDLLENYESK